MTNQNGLALAEDLLRDKRLEGFSIGKADADAGSQIKICFLIGDHWEFLPAEPIFGKTEQNQ